mgnify:CR=1 FL=1
MNEIDVKSHLIRGLVKNDNLWDKTESAANCGSLLKVNFFLFFFGIGILRFKYTAKSYYSIKKGDNGKEW